MTTPQKWLENELKKYVSDDEEVSKIVKDYEYEFGGKEQPENQTNELSNLIKDLKNELVKSRERNDRLESDLLFFQITNSPSQGKDKEISEIASELSDSNKKLEDEKKEKSRLEKEIFEKEAEERKLKSEGKIGSEEYKELLEAIRGLKNKLADINQKIEELRGWIANLKEQLNANYLTLQEEIEKIKEMLERKLEECEDKIKKNYLGVKASEKISTLLQAQKEITRNNSSFVTNEKEIIIKSIPKKLTEEIEVLCILQEQLTRLEMKKEDIEKISQVLKTVMIAPIIPPHLQNEGNNSRLKDKFNVEKEITYNKIFSEMGESPLQKKHKTEKLPTRLYNIRENRVIVTKNNTDISGYTILSYVWGNPNEESNKLSEEQKKELDNTTINLGYENGDLLTLLGYKSWKKAIKTCEFLKIDYLWIDQLCIIQSGEESRKDKENEIPKMRQYYTNAGVTLIALNEEVGDIDLMSMLGGVINSEWFSRSWTFQEGWLSKWTLFMFDDKLIDGRALASQWVLGQPSYTSYGHYKNILDEGSQKIATPLGWVYYKEGYNDEDRVSLSLNDSLRTIKRRGRGISIDGIYSILGLLPYGHEVKVRYKEGNYTVREIRERLLDVMKIAWEKGGRGEYFSWYGTGDWLPEVYDKDGDNNDTIQKRVAGGTSIEGGLTIIHKQPEKTFGSDHIELTTFSCSIKTIKNREAVKKEKDRLGFIMDSGACVRRILVDKIKDEVELLGTSDLLEKNVKKGDILLLLSKKEWRSNKPFVLIVRKNNDIYQRIGLAEIKENDWEKLQQVGEERKLTIKMDEEQIQVQAQIQIPPKNN